MNIIIYTKTGCPWCRDVLSFLEESGIKFEERVVSGNPVFFEEMVTKSKQSKAPTLDIDGDILADSDAKAVKAYLVEKGILDA